MAKILGFLSPDELTYIIVLLVSLHSGFVIRCFNAKLKGLLSCLLGIVLVYLTCGIHIFHALLVTLVTILAIQIFPRKVSHIFVFIWCFAYLLVFRLPGYFGLPKPNAIANAVQLIITLKLVGLAFELSDSCALSDKVKTAKSEEIINLYLRKECCSINPTPVEMFQYAFCYIGLFTGPYYKYRTYHDMLEWPTNVPRPSNKLFFQRLQDLPVCAFMFFVFSYFFSIDAVKSPKFYKNPLWYRFGAMIWIFCIFRFRMYCAWIMSECLCMSSLLGMYPVKAKSASGNGPTDLKALKDWRAGRFTGSSSTENIATKNSAWIDVSALGAKNANTNHHHHQSHSNVPLVPVEYDFATISNISIWGCECTPTVREGMKSWNTTVQYWLAVFVHQRCLGPKFFRTCFTMLVSAYWHGIHSGYYLSFSLIPLALLAESSLPDVVYSLGFLAPPGTLTFLQWLLKMRVFEYCSMGFLLLEYGPTLKYWGSVYFCMHLLLLAVIAWGKFVRFVDPTAPSCRPEPLNWKTSQPHHAKSN